jgi:uncharacterized protein (DUF1800 family)
MRVQGASFDREDFPVTDIRTSIAVNRFGLGARPDEPMPTDPRRWLISQLDRFDPAPPPIAALADRATIVTTFNDYRNARRAEKRRGTALPAPRQKSATGTTSIADRERELRAFYVDAIGARTDVALTTPAPFIERLVHFWANHFAVSADKKLTMVLAGSFEFEAIRPHVLGRFGDMLSAVERHPAMLFYLDQAQSIGPNSPRGSRITAHGKRKAGLNENLGREAIELHTLGVRSGYSQADVTELSRALTGWGFAGLYPGRAKGEREPAPGKFVFDERVHEPGVRTIMGKRYAQQGEAQAQAVLDDLAVHPATAKHIATKLARHFAADSPPPTLVARLEAAFLESGGDLPAVYRALTDAPEAWTPAPAKFKSPWEWGVSTMRAMGRREAPGRAVRGLMSELGQPVWQPGSPAGYDDVASAWAAPDAVLRRVQAAGRMASRADAVDARALAPLLFPGTLAQSSREALARADSPGQALALLLVTPEMMRR